MEAVRAWFDAHERQGSVCRHLHLSPRKLFVCEPFRPIVTGDEPPLIPVPTFEAALRLLGANRPARREADYLAPVLASPRQSPRDGRQSTVRTVLRADSDPQDSCSPVRADARQSGTWHDASNAAASVQPLLATYKDAAAMLATTPRNLRELVAAGKLRAVGYGKGRRIVVASILEYAAALERAAVDARQ